MKSGKIIKKNHYTIN